MPRPCRVKRGRCEKGAIRSSKLAVRSSGNLEHRTWPVSRAAGVNIHVDAAAVDVNFLITPGETNFDQETDGPVFFDQEVPQGWNVQEYNSDKNEPKIFTWLDQLGAKTVRI